jgi:hypothetical protein
MNRKALVVLRQVIIAAEVPASELGQTVSDILKTIGKRDEPRTEILKLKKAVRGIDMVSLYTK